jgi:hypothetical protein
MATSDESEMHQLLARAPAPLPEPTWSGPGDLARMSVEAMVAQSEELRELESAGKFRLTGAGVLGHAADLDDVGQVATLWQRCITAVGAALEGAKATVGRIPESIVLRTQLTLNAAPGPGSIVLALAPKSDPFRETAPGGARQMFDAPRPLADRSAETLIELLAKAAGTGPDGDDLGAVLKALGPRVATSVRTLADVLDRAHFDVDITWSEPDQPTRRVEMSAGTSGWLRDFVSGRALDGVEEELAGTVRTVSDIAKWSIETPEGDLVPVNASSLAPEVTQSTRVGQFIRMIVFLRMTERPDGTNSATRDVVSILSSD